MKMTGRIKYCIATCLVMGILYLIGIADMDYGYYTFLRIVSLFALAILIGAYSLEVDRFLTPVTFVAGLILILFNPITPIYLDKEIWMVLDGVCGGILFALAIYIFCSRNKYKDEQE